MLPDASRWLQMKTRDNDDDNDYDDDSDDVDNDAHYLHNYYLNQGINAPEVYVESYVALNGRLSQKYIDSKINLANENESFKHKTWILPFNDTIKGF